MAKIDTSKIDGYAAMTAEQKVAALEAFDSPEEQPDLSGYVKKDLYDKAAHDAADWKKKHNALLSAEELAKQQHDEKMAGMQNELDELRKDRKVSAFKAKYLALGYPEDLATSTAAALESGDTDTVFANQKAFDESRAEAEKKKRMIDTPRPPAGDPGGEKKVDYAKLSTDAMAEGNYAAAAYYTRLANEAAEAEKKGE